MHLFVATIERMDARGTLEVEHILRLARHPAPELGADLDALSGKLGWREEIVGTLADSHLVPFGSWSMVVSEYCKGGYSALAPLCRGGETATFVVGLVKGIRCEASVAFLMREFSALVESPESDLAFSHEIASALNSLLSFKPFVLLHEELEASVRRFLHSFLANAETDEAKGAAMCALRSVGDESSLRAIEIVSLESPAWKSSQVACKRAILKRVRKKF